MSDFYEDDEPLEDLLDAWGAGTPAISRRPGITIVDCWIFDSSTGEP